MGLLNLTSLSGLAQVWRGWWGEGRYRDFFLIGRATLPAGIPRASAFLRPSLPLRACPGFSLVLTFPPVFLSLRGIVLSILRQCLILLPQYLNGTDLSFFTKVINLFKIHGPKVRMSRSIMSGLSRVEISVVNHRDCWNQDSN